MWLWLHRRRFLQVATGLFGVGSERLLGFGQVGAGQPKAATQSKQFAGAPQAGRSAGPPDQTQIFRVPGAEYKSLIETFVIEFLNHYHDSRPYPISRIFEIFPIQVSEQGTSKDLIDRGTLKFTKSVVSNVGTKLEVPFADQNIGKLAVVFNQQVQATVKATSDRAFSVTFDKTYFVPVVFFNLDPKLELGSNQRLESIAFDEKTASYTLHEAKDQNRRLKIIVDLNLKTPPAKRALLHGGAMLVNVQNSDPNSDKEDTRFFIGGFRCDCCGGHPGDSSTAKNKPIQLYPRCCTFLNGQYAGHYDGTPFGRGEASQRYIGRLITIIPNPLQTSCTSGCEPDLGEEVTHDVTIKVSQITVNDNFVTNRSCTVIRGAASN